MRKTVIILSVLTLIAGSCGLATKKQTATKNNVDVGVQQESEFSQKIESPYQITNFQTCSDEISTDSIQAVNETCLITVMPETKEFEDENSEEAEAYFTAMDDWAYYNNETCEQFEKMGIKNVVAKKKYLLFTLNANKQIIVNTKAEQSFGDVSTLLYKKGRIPIFVFPIIGDNDMESIKKYLNN